MWAEADNQPSNSHTPATAHTPPQPQWPKAGPAAAEARAPPAKPETTWAVFAVAGAEVVVRARVWLATWEATRASVITRGVITDAIPPGDLLLLLVALANWTAVVPQMGRILTGTQDADRDRLRASIKEAARRLVAR
ncbi:hypothetical protein I3F55_26790 [Streptomyces sp. MUM 16J]|nr:hypothetical protein [Streptomyces sp. MUM 16J]